MRLFRTLVAVALGAVMTASGAIAETPKNTLVIADAIDDIITLDPAEVSEVGGVLTSQQIYQPLVSFDPADPDQDHPASSPRAGTVSDDGKTFTFKMNPAAKFASGNPVTAYRRGVLAAARHPDRQPHLLHPDPVRPDQGQRRGKDQGDRRRRRWCSKVDQKYAPSFVLYVLSSFTGGIVDSELVKEHEGTPADGTNDYGNAWLKSENSAGSGPYVLDQVGSEGLDPAHPQRELLGHRSGRRTHLPPAHAGIGHPAPRARKG